MHRLSENEKYYVNCNVNKKKEIFIDNFVLIVEVNSSVMCNGNYIKYNSSQLLLMVSLNHHQCFL